MKKVSYVCRKDVADNRLRIKGRFVKNQDQKEIINKVIGAGSLEAAASTASN